jgi:hypothetical protein
MDFKEVYKFPLSSWKKDASVIRTKDKNDALVALHLSEDCLATCVRLINDEDGENFFTDVAYEYPYIFINGFAAFRVCGAVWINKLIKPLGITAKQAQKIQEEFGEYCANKLKGFYYEVYD